MSQHSWHVTFVNTIERQTTNQRTLATHAELTILQQAVTKHVKHRQSTPWTELLLPLSHHTGLFLISPRDRSRLILSRLTIISITIFDLAGTPTRAGDQEAAEVAMHIARRIRHAQAAPAPSIGPREVPARAQPPPMGIRIRWGVGNWIAISPLDLHDVASPLASDPCPCSHPPPRRTRPRASASRPCGCLSWLREFLLFDFGARAIGSFCRTLQPRSRSIHGIPRPVLLWPCTPRCPPVVRTSPAPGPQPPRAVCLGR